MRFMSNHNHSEDSNFRLRDCIIRAEDIVNRAVELGFAGVSITDHETLSAHVRILQRYLELKKLKEKYDKSSAEEIEADKDLRKNKKLLEKMDPEFKLGLGNEIYLVNSLEEVKDNYVSGETKFWHFILIAKNQKGYQQIREISSKSAWENWFRQGKMERVPTVKSELEAIIGEEKGNIIASTACFTKGHKVLTKQGEKNIEEFIGGEEVLTDKLTWEKVITPTSRLYKDKGYTLRFSNSIDKITCTKDHKFLTINKHKRQRTDLSSALEWVEAQNLKKGDWCLSPIEEIAYSNIKELDLSPLMEDFNLASFVSLNRVKNINTTIPITPEFMRTMGYWLADGHLRKMKTNLNNHGSDIGFSINKDEFERYYNSFIKKGMESFGIEPIIKVREKE